MGSRDPTPVADQVNGAALAPVDRACPGKKVHGKIPKRIHKAVREKKKREHLNDLFLELSDALELNEQNTGKATILCEATKLLKDLLGQIESLRNENVTLLSESNYMTIEKNELGEDTSALETHIERLQGELQERMLQSKPDLNIPPVEFGQEVSSHFAGNCLGLPAQESALHQAPAVFVMPLHPDLQTDPATDSAHLASKNNSNVSKPHARYPTSVDCWPLQLLGEQPAAGKDSR
ncbi:transcription factor bHLH47 [Argentina anserina]|uniref:transcription factor bHLH47 n=1 Tax=Argentina anserina TaxID=57926 RepID=UPI0021768B22|nr:transcription factor bHLH47 [Potentilla anserina]